MRGARPLRDLRAGRFPRKYPRPAGRVLMRMVLSGCSARAARNVATGLGLRGPGDGRIARDLIVDHEDVGAGRRGRSIGRSIVLGQVRAAPQCRQGPRAGFLGCGQGLGDEGLQPAGRRSIVVYAQIVQDERQRGVAGLKPAQEAVLQQYGAPPGPRGQMLRPAAAALAAPAQDGCAAGCSKARRAPPQRHPAQERAHRRVAGDGARGCNDGRLEGNAHDAHAALREAAGPRGRGRRPWGAKRWRSLARSPTPTRGTGGPKRWASADHDPALGCAVNLGDHKAR